MSADSTPTPVVTYGERDHAWLHPWRRWFVELDMIEAGRVVHSRPQHYVHSEEEARLIADGYLYRYAHTI